MTNCISCEMADAKIAFDRLNDVNWSTWRFRMELLLMKEDLWMTVKDPKPEPEGITSAWNRKDEKARAVIGLALDDSQLIHVMEAVSANDMWEKLKSYHERGSLSNKIHVLRKLCSMRLEENGNLSNHLMEASELVHRLARVGEMLKEHLVVAILLSSLPESYNPLVTALEGRPENDLKVDYVKGKLLDEWRRKSEKLNENVRENAMKSTLQTENRRSFIRACYYCGREGHFQRNCPVLLEETKADMKKQPQVKSTTFQQLSPRSSGEDRGVCFNMTTSGDVTEEKWIIDTGCTKHMTNSTTSLGWWNPCSAEVMLPDGKIVKAKGRGQGRIVGVGMDGERIEVKLKEVLYVPGLSRNVLSVNRITEEGYSVVFGRSSCQILDANKVVAVGKKFGGLYYLKH